MLDSFEKFCTSKYNKLKITTLTSSPKHLSNSMPFHTEVFLF